MATFVGLHNQIYWGHLDLTGQANQLDFSDLTREMKDATTFADGGYRSHLPGLISGSVKVGGFNDWAADVLDDEISTGQLGTQYPISVIPNPTGTVTAGDVAWFTRGVFSGHQLPMTKGELAQFGMEAGLDTVIVRGQVAHAKAARTATGNGTTLTLTGPSATQSLYCGLHVTAFSGLTSLVVTVESDDASNMASATTRLTMATVTGTTSEWKSVTGSFSGETHHRIVYTIVGTGSVTFAAFLGVI
jgi:hypothetical protein